MPRAPRMKSESGIYHVMLRGINKENIFLNDVDKQRIIEIIKKYKQACKFELYAYCVMSNHIHLLIKETDNNPIDNIIKRIACSYVTWYNERYRRVGHLFQDRFRSEPVNDDQYFLTVLRYIHQNPVKVGLDEFKWSSLNNYKQKNKTFVDTDFAFGIVAYDELMEFMMMSNEDVCLDEETKEKKMNSSDAESFFKEISGCNTSEEFSTFSLSKKINIISMCRESGITENKISELTGISRYNLTKIN